MLNKLASIEYDDSSSRLLTIPVICVSCAIADGQHRFSATLQ